LTTKKRVLFFKLILLQVFLCCLSCYFVVGYLDYTLDLGHFVKLPAFIIFIVFIFIGFLFIWIVKEILRLTKMEREVEIALARLEENQILLETLKARQHDFANHLQVVYGLVYLGKKEEVKKYMQTVAADLKILDRITNLKRPELAALLCKKMAVARSIVFKPHVETDLALLPLPPNKVVSIMGNLLDNAIYEAQNQKEDKDKKVVLYVGEREGHYIFKLWNPGFIEEDIQDKIFIPGFTTKEQEGSGMGLHIVKTIVLRYGGSIEFTSDVCKGTLFKVIFPKKPSISTVFEEGYFYGGDF
jgi:two-component system sensor histidine kinase AgrC